LNNDFKNPRRPIGRRGWGSVFVHLVPMLAGILNKCITLGKIDETTITKRQKITINRTGGSNKKIKIIRSVKLLY